MKKHWLPWFQGVLWLMLGILCWCFAVGALFTRESLWSHPRVSYRDNNAALSESDLDALRDAINENNGEGMYGGDVAGWTQALSKTIAVKEISSSTTVDVLWVDGNASYVWNVACIDGNLPALGDNEGCAIDTETALTIFGSLQVVGKTVWVDGQELVIRGVYTMPDGPSTLAVDPGRGMAICSFAAAPEGVTMTALEFTVLGNTGRTGSDQAKEWMRFASLSTSGTMDDHSEQKTMLQIMLTFPAYLLFLFVLIEVCMVLLEVAQKALGLHRYLRESHIAERVQFLHVWGNAFAILILAGGLIYAAASIVPPLRSIPPSYLPTKWSDFSFWSTLLQDCLTDKARQALAVSLRPDMVWGRLTDWCTWLTVLSAVMLWRARNLLIKNYKCIAFTSAMLLVCVICGSAFASVFILHKIGWNSAVPSYILYLPSMLYLSIVIFRVGRMPELWKEVTTRRLDRLIKKNA